MPAVYHAAAVALGLFPCGRKRTPSPCRARRARSGFPDGKPA
jgi:hypothetical protein